MRGGRERNKGTGRKRWRVWRVVGKKMNVRVDLRVLKAGIVLNFGVKSFCSRKRRGWCRKKQKKIGKVDEV